ncbi:MAG: VWA domain-containing protein [Kofleriaceae bacterium]|nr:VWA domain-containing protein [Kofleriaceae bacterium]MCL4225735.1 VWA domain-containing protein [Myxococcales bacterium]
MTRLHLASFAHLVAAAVAAVALAACGGTSTGGLGPCETGIPDPACRLPCISDGNCPTGFHCGDDGTCTAECSPDGSGCGAGQSCDNSGHCFDDTSGTDGNDCPSVTVSPMPRTPSVQLLIDQSGSMTQNFGGVTRWNAVKNALVGGSGVVTTLGGQVVFGASLYTYNRNNDSSCPRISRTPTRMLNNAGAISTLLDGAQPDADTPTGESIQRVIQDFQQNPPPANSVPVILLATDGEPDRCSNPDAHDAQSRQMSVDAAAAAYAAGIRTIVLSVGNDTGEDHLQAVANAGAGQNPQTGTATFYRANNPAELSAALSQIITGILSCEFDLSGVVDVNRADEGTVTLSSSGGGTCQAAGNLTHGSQWEMVDENTIRVLGAACDALKAGSCTLQATFACGTIIL